MVMVFWLFVVWRNQEPEPCKAVRAKAHGNASSVNDGYNVFDGTISVCPQIAAITRTFVLAARNLSEHVRLMRFACCCCHGVLFRSWVKDAFGAKALLAMSCDS
jgi:hypothetical protein